MDNKHTRQELKEQGKRIIAEAKKNLVKHQASGELVRSLRFQVRNEGGKLVLKIFAAEYADVLDKGLSGYRKQRAGTKYKAVSSKVAGFKGVRGNTVAVDWLDIKKWARLKGVRFAGKTANTTAFLIHRKLKFRGYKGTKWFTKTRNKVLREMTKHVAGAFKKDALDTIRLVTKKSKKR